MEFYAISDLKKALHLAIEFYNNERPHWSLEGMTPKQAAECTGELKKKWTSYREIAIKRKCA